MYCNDVNRAQIPHRDYHFFYFFGNERQYFRAKPVPLYTLAPKKNRGLPLLSGLLTKDYAAIKMIYQTLAIAIEISFN